MNANSIQAREVSLPTALGFGLGSLGTGVFTTVPSVLLLFYLTTAVHLPPIEAGLIALAPKLLGVATDPVLGHLSDRVRRGRRDRRRWIMTAGAILTGLGLWALFTLPARVSPSAMTALFTYLVATLGYSLFAVPYASLPPELAEAPSERNSLVGTRLALAFVGTLIGGVAGPLLAGVAGYASMGLALGAVSAGAMALCLAQLRLRPAGPIAPRRSGLQDLVTAGKGRLGRETAAFVLLLAAFGVLTATMPFLITERFRLAPSAVSLAGLAAIGAALPVAAAWPTILRTLSVAWGWRLAVALMASGALLAALAPHADILFFGSLAIAGAGFAGVQVTGFSVLAAAGADNEGAGALTGFWLAGEKIGLALGPLIAGSLLQYTVLFGSRVHALQAAAGAAPLVLSLMALLVLGLGRPRSARPATPSRR